MNAEQTKDAMNQPSPITVGAQTFQLADLGPESPLPSVQPLLEPPYVVGEGIPDEIAAGSRWGKAPNIYPYPMQESYSRQVSPVELTSVVLENSHIRATFLPELGGRLWSLFDKASGKELLHAGERIQFANLALRNAWFAGGIEFNIGTRGHSPTTSSPLHAAIVQADDGQQVLRMWEFDRLREVVFQIDAWLPEDSPVVFVAVRIRNPNEHTVPMYWWTNAAVPQTDQTRVLAPAKAAYITDYDGSMTRADPTDFHGVDASWPARNPRAADFFFDLAREQRRWEVALDADGDGLALVSSSRLRGRKLFVWGESVGGHRWQAWLSPGAQGSEPRRYAEIQSGLAQTQFEHLPLGASQSWHWVEAYGNAALDASIAGGDWDGAVEHAAERVEQLVSEAAIDEALADAKRWADLAPEEPVQVGSGWGALERNRRRHAELSWIDETGTPFALTTAGPEQRPWLSLLESVAQGSPLFDGAQSFVRGDEWDALLADCPGAAAVFHRATLAHAKADPGSADQLAASIDAYRLALSDDDLVPATRALAWRGLGLALLCVPDTHGTRNSGLDALARACAVDPANRWLLVEAMTRSLAHDAPGRALDLASKAPESLTAIGRVQFLTAQAHALTGSTEVAGAMLREGIEIADIREGENSISALWREVCPGEDVPDEYQFGMH